MDLVTRSKVADAVGTVGGETQSAEVDAAFQQAEAHYQEAVRVYKDRNLPGAIAALEEALRHNPEHEDAEYRLGCYRKELDHLKMDVEELRQAVSQDPNDAKSRFALAESLYSLGCIDEAALQFQQVAEQPDPYLSTRARNALSRM